LSFYIKCCLIGIKLWQIELLEYLASLLLIQEKFTLYFSSDFLNVDALILFSDKFLMIVKKVTCNLINLDFLATLFGHISYVFI